MLAAIAIPASLEPRLLVSSGGDMQRVNAFWFYDLGHRVHAVLSVKEDSKIGEIYSTLYTAEYWLDSFLDGSEIFPFTVSLQSARELRSAIGEIIDGEADFNRALTIAEAAELTRLTRTFETVVGAEVVQFHTYSVVKKLAYDTRTLLEEGDALLPPGVRNNLPADCINDLREAAKCVAFEVNTAAAFHTIRATEAVIRAYYFEVVGSLPKVKDRNWGAYLRVLKSKGGDPRITGFLDHIREAYRNPITHPEQRVDAQEAQILLGVCVSAIIQMVMAMPNAFS